MRTLVADLALAAVALIAACRPGDNLGPDAQPLDAAIDADPRPVVRVLFIGNSYTGVNDLPGVVARMSTGPSSPVRFAVAMYAPGGTSWENHDADPMVATLIAEGWDDVVLQDQSEQPWFVAGIKPALLSLDRKITATGARTVLYMSWARGPSLAGPDLRFVQNLAVNYYYERHAEVTGALVAPVGRAWERALRDPAVTLHDVDGSHPNPQGTYLAACVFHATLTGASPLGLGDGGLGLAPADAARLQRVAWSTIEVRRRPAPPLIGAWPLADETSGGDLVPMAGVVLGGVPGPHGTAATHFDVAELAAIPYRPGTSPPQLTVALTAALDDWSVPGGAADEFLVGRWDAYSIFRRGTELRAEVTTGDDATTTTATLGFAAAGLAAGWHRLALTYDGATVALWLDGAAVASTTTSGPLRYGGSASGGTGVAIAARPSSNPESAVLGGSPFPGALANLRLYDRALPAADL